MQFGGVMPKVVLDCWFADVVSDARTSTAQPARFYSDLSGEAPHPLQPITRGVTSRTSRHLFKYKHAQKEGAVKATPPKLLSKRWKLSWNIKPYLQYVLLV